MVTENIRAAIVAAGRPISEIAAAAGMCVGVMGSSPLSST
jgi:hypothetical protein